MDGQPPGLQPGIHVHLSDVIPASAYTYLAAFLPGLFFEISVALANPGLVTKIAVTSPQALIQNQYIEWAVILFIAFTLGNGFMMFISLIRWFLREAYISAFFARRRVYERFLIPRVDRWIAKRLGAPGKSVPRWLAGLKGHFNYFTRGIDEETKEINQCLGILATRLLESKYSVKLDDQVHISNWSAFYITLAKPTPVEIRGEPIMTATHATGWSGLVAAALAPKLANLYYLSFSGLLIVMGLIYDYYLERNKGNPVLSGLANIRGLLREFDTTKKSPPPEDR